MRLHLSDFKSLGMKSRLYARYSDNPTIIAVWRAVAFWHQVTLIFSSLWRSVFMVTHTKLMHNFKKLSDNGSIHKLQNSVLQAYVSWKLVLTNAWTCRENILFSYLIRNVILNKKLSNKQIFTMYFYFPIKPLSWSVLCLVSECRSHTDLKLFRLQHVPNMKL